jgi:hypothetical protein
MDIQADEIESVKVIGNLFGTDVKLVKTTGGFHVAIGQKNKKSKKKEALAAGSHQAIVAHSISKEFGSDFQPALAKSEHDRLETVIEKTQYLPREAIEKGIELFTLSKGNKHDCVLYKRGISLAKYEARVENQTLVIQKSSMNVKPDMKVARAIARALEDKASELNLKIKQK